MLAMFLRQQIQCEVTMKYRKHDDEHVVDTNNVWPLIPVTDEKYQAWLAEGNQPLEQEEEQ